MISVRGRRLNADWLKCRGPLWRRSAFRIRWCGGRGFALRGSFRAARPRRAGGPEKNLRTE